MENIETEKDQLWAVYLPTEDKYLHFEKSERDSDSYSLDFDFLEDINESKLVLASTNNTPLIPNDEIEESDDDIDDGDVEDSMVKLEEEFVVAQPEIKSKLTLKLWHLVKEFDGVSDKVFIVKAFRDSNGELTLDFTKSHKLIN